MDPAVDDPTPLLPCVETPDDLDVISERAMPPLFDPPPLESPPPVLLIPTAGFTYGSSGEASGHDAGTADVSIIAGTIAEGYPEATVVPMSYQEQQEIVNTVIAAEQSEPDTRSILMGHSGGAETVLRAAQELSEAGYPPDAVITLDAVGLSDPTVPSIPSDVGLGLNFSSTSGDGVDGKPFIDGAINIGVPNTSHTEIENEACVRDTIYDHVEAIIAAPSSSGWGDSSSTTAPAASSWTAPPADDPQPSIFDSSSSIGSMSGDSSGTPAPAASSWTAPPSDDSQPSIFDSGSSIGSTSGDSSSSSDSE